MRRETNAWSRDDIDLGLPRSFASDCWKTVLQGLFVQADFLLRHSSSELHVRPRVSGASLVSAMQWLAVAPVSNILLCVIPC